MTLDLPAIRAWNSAQKRARREYAAHPIASCRGVRRVDGEAVDCTHMATARGLCRCCEFDRKAAARRRAERRRDA